MGWCRRLCMVTGIGVLGVVVPASAQVAWDSPMLMPPGVNEGLGLYLVDVEGGDLGGLVTWRLPTWNFGVRAGFAEAFDKGIGAFGGIDFNGALTHSTPEFPLDIDWVFGAGIGIDDGARISVPLGLSVGHDFDNGENVHFKPYATPRVVLDGFLGDEDGVFEPDDSPGDDDRFDRDDVRLGFALDIGLDLRFTPDFLVRFGATVGDRDGVAVGVVF